MLWPECAVAKAVLQGFGCDFLYLAATDSFFARRAAWSRGSV
jgi:hypothetical protein